MRNNSGDPKQILQKHARVIHLATMLRISLCRTLTKAGALEQEGAATAPTQAGETRHGKHPQGRNSFQPGLRS